MTSQLDRIERLLLESRLGFSSGSQRAPVYCNRSKGGLWYTLDKVGDDLSQYRLKASASPAISKAC
jgi:hypothetical protein